MVLGLLLARAGVDVVVLEKHADFLRDFRGDTVHPSTLQVLQELGLLQAFLQRPHDKARDIRVHIGGAEAVVADFGRLKGHCGFIAMVPQWEFLDFLRDEAELYPGFRLLLQAQALSLIEDQGRVTGLRAGTPQGALEVHADLVIGADGRRSTLREAAGLQVRDLGAPIDVLWMRVPRLAGDPQGSGGRIGTGRFLATIDRGSYWQCAYVIHKGGIESVRSRGIEALRGDLVELMLLASREASAMPWQLKLLGWFPALRALPAYAVGVGVRPEHVRSPLAAPRRVPATG